MPRFMIETQLPCRPRSAMTAEGARRLLAIVEVQRREGGVDLD